MKTLRGKEIPQGHREEEEKGIVLKWVIHKTRCMTSSAPERKNFVVTVVSHIIQVNATIEINFSEGVRQTWVGDREKS